MTWAGVLIWGGLAALAFAGVVTLGRWLNSNKHRYELADIGRPGQKPNQHMPPAVTNVHTVDDPYGVPISETADGIRFELIKNGTCPHCRNRAAKFYAGPAGGLTQNIQCEICGWWFNVTVFPGGHGDGVAQDIGFKSKSDDWLNERTR